MIFIISFIYFVFLLKNLLVVGHQSSLENNLILIKGYYGFDSIHASFDRAELVSHYKNENEDCSAVHLGTQ